MSEGVFVISSCNTLPTESLQVDSKAGVWEDGNLLTHAFLIQPVWEFLQMYVLYICHLWNLFLISVFYLRIEKRAMYH